MFNASTSAVQSLSAASTGYVIRQPTTTQDDGTPSMSLSKDMDRILRLSHDERHITAYKLLESVRDRLRTSAPVTVKSPKKGILKRKPKITPDILAVEADYVEAKQLLEKNKEALENLEKRAKIFQNVQLSLHDPKHQWVFSQTLFGVTTYYRKEPDNSISIKMEGELHGCPLFEQIAVLREVDLHYKWAPFCSSSLAIKDLDKLDTVGWFCLGIPQFGLARDGCFRAIGCDNMMEGGQIIIAGQGLQDRGPDEPYAEPYLLVEGLDIPDPPTRLGCGRMTIKSFVGCVDVLSPTSVRTTLIANVNPNIPLIPQSLLDFIMRKMCGIVIGKLQGAAKKAANNPVRNIHSRRMRQEEAFYRGWLLPKFQAYCRVLKWDMPEVAAFTLTDAELDDEGNRLHNNKVTMKASRSYDEQRAFSPHDGSIHTQSEPHDMYPGDDMSADMSTMSGLTAATFFAKNPISNYLREVEEKTLARKTGKIERARQRAANRLKPKAFNDVDTARLEELKKVKERRLHTTQIATPQITSPPHTTPISILHQHDRPTQIIMICSLATIMFVLLYADKLTGLGSFLGSSDHSWWTSLAIDLGTLCYLVACAATHFVFCDVALVYAFDALEIGLKTGQDTKRFYDGNIRILVAFASGGFITLAVVKATTTTLLRNFVWYTIVAGKFGNEVIASATASLYAMPIAGFIPSSVVMFPVKLVSWAVGAGAVLFRIISSTIYFISWFLDLVLVQSNGVGGFLSFLVGNAVSMIPSPSASFGNYVEHVINVFEGGESMPSWRAEAVDTSRHLLVDTAVFLLSMLVLFTASMKSSQRRIHDSLERTESFKVDKITHSLQRSVSRNEVVEERPDAFDISVDPAMTESVTLGGTKRLRFPKLRLRRRNTRPDQAPSSTPVALRRATTS